MDGQISIFDCARLNDKTCDRVGRSHDAPSWMKYERCENCVRWAKYPANDQPPYGWGCFGWCNSHNQKVQASSYCMNWEDRVMR